MTEREQAIELANRILDRVNADPDDDLAILARQLLRALEAAPTSEEVRSLVRVLSERGQKIEWDGGDVSADQQLLRAADVIERLDRERQELRQWQRDMVAKAADKSLAGYRELGAKCAELEDRAERAEADRERTQRTLEETVESMGRTIIRVEAERDAAIKDAERYRWLRDGFLRLEENYLHTEQELILLGGPLWRQRKKDGYFEFKDDAIDAAMREGKG